MNVFFVNKQKHPSKQTELLSFTQPIKKFSANTHNTKPDLKTNIPPIPYQYNDYLETVTWAGKVIRTGKKGYLSEDGQLLLNNYNIQKENWLDTIKHFSKRFYRVIGKVHMIDLCDKGDEEINIAWLRGKSGARRFYGEAA